MRQKSTDVSDQPPHRGIALIDPIAMPIPEAIRISGLTRGKLYYALASGDLKAVKAGDRTLILMDSLKAYLANLPVATFRPPHHNIEPRPIGRGRPPREARL